MSDYLLRFGFTELPVRGVMADLSECWQQLCEQRSYAEPVSVWLAQALLAVTLIRSGIKDHGKLGLQLRSSSALRLLSADCNEQLHVRAAANCVEGAAVPTGLHELTDGVMALALHDANQVLSQGMVALRHADMATLLEHYFDQSEQLQTRFVLYLQQQRVTGMLLQRLPGADHDDDWRRLGLMLDTLQAAEMQQLQPQQLLARLFAEDEVIVYSSQQPTYQCSCERERVAAVLLQLGRDDVDALLREQHMVTVDCEHCGRVYRFDRVDVEQLFIAGKVATPSSVVLQ